MNDTLNTKTDNSPWLTKEEAAARLKVHPRTLDRWADAGKITRYAPSDVQQAHVRFLLSEVDAILKPQPAVGPDAGDDATEGQ